LTSNRRKLSNCAFGGLSIEETAEVLGVALSTVKRDWATARLFRMRG